MTTPKLTKEDVQKLHSMDKEAWVPVVLGALSALGAASSAYDAYKSTQKGDYGKAAGHVGLGILGGLFPYGKAIGYLPKLLAARRVLGTAKAVEPALAEASGKGLGWFDSFGSFFKNLSGQRSIAQASRLASQNRPSLNPNLATPLAKEIAQYKNLASGQHLSNQHPIFKASDVVNKKVPWYVQAPAMMGGSYLLADKEEGQEPTVVDNEDPVQNPYIRDAKGLPTKYLYNPDTNTFASNPAYKEPVKRPTAVASNKSTYPAIPSAYQFDPRTGQTIRRNGV